MKQSPGKPFWFTCLLLLIAANWGLAQNYFLTYRHLSVQDGMSSRFITSVLQDNQGFVWLGSDYGINRFDGRNFKIFNSNNSKIRTNSWAVIQKDISGKIWVNSDNHQVDIFDPYSESVTKLEQLYPELKGGKITLFNKWLFRNGVWGVIENDTIFHFNGQLKKANFGLTAHQKTNWCPTNWGSVLLEDSTSLYEVNLDGNTLNRFPTLKRAVYYAALTDSTLLIVTLSSNRTTKQPQPSFWEMNKNSNLKQIHLTNKGEPFVIDSLLYVPSNFCINRDVQGNLWFLSKNKLHVFDANGALTLEDDKSKNYWSQFNGTKVFFDNQNQAWVSAIDGIYTISIKPSKFRKLLQNPSQNISVRGMAELPNGQLLACTYDGLYRIDTHTGLETKLKSDNYFGALKASDNTIWLGRHSTQIAHLSPSLQNLSDVKISLPINKLDEILRPFEDSFTSEIYFGSRHKGLLVLNKQTGIIEPYPLLNLFKELASLEILHLLPTKECIWVASSNGLYKLDRKKGIVARFDHFPENFIYHIEPDKSGVFWLSTKGGGLLKWDRPRSSFKQYSTANGLSNDIVYAAYDDGLGYLWLPSNYGLMRFDKSAGITNNFLPSDGISFEEFNNSSHLRTSDGTFYFGSLSGITAFKPAEIVSDKFNVPLVVTGYKVLQENELLDKMADFRTNGRIVIQPNEKFFTLELALLDMQARNYLYAWKMEGFDENWNYQKENSIRFNALPYGDFILRIKAEGFGSNWSGHELSIPITVIQPFYKTWNFALLLLLAIALATFFLVRWRIRWLRREKQRLAELVEARTQELSLKNSELASLNQTKDRLFSIIAHDLRSPLVTLGGLSRKIAFLLRQNRTAEVMELGDSIEKSVDNVRNLLDNLLKWSMIQDGRFPHHPEPLELGKVVEEVVAIYKNVAEAKGVALIYNQVGNPLAFADANGLSTITRNLVDNAIKFTPESGKVEVSVESRGNGSYIKVRDTGSGIPSEELPNIFTLKSKRGRRGSNGEMGNGLGLVLCHELVEINRGAIQAANNRDGGAVFEVSVPASAN